MNLPPSTPIGNPSAPTIAERATRERWLAIAAGILGGALIATLSMGACAASPSQRAQAAKVESDLCRLRLLAAALEAVNPALQPPEGSIRAQIEASEDALCAKLDDGQAGSH